MSSTSTSGIAVYWPDGVEYFFGFDIDNLNERTTITTHLYLGKGDPLYLKLRADAEVQTKGKKRSLILTYDKVKNKHVKNKIDFVPGVNQVTDLDKGFGSCIWQIKDNGGSSAYNWKKFGPKEKERIEDNYFSDKIFSSDKCQCVLSGETTVKVLDAAHLSSKKSGGDDSPFNGILLRSDLHRLFDAGLFHFDKSGRVKITDYSDSLSNCYKVLLRDKRLPKDTFDRVRHILGILEKQRNRQ